MSFHLTSLCRWSCACNHHWHLKKSNASCDDGSVISVSFTLCEGFFVHSKQGYKQRQ
eukprot:m.144953 g.144953  ORF g.144953 m.144953 type:complete len:57 (-) comp30403_c0_seq1:220-390(-)